MRGTRLAVVALLVLAAAAWALRSVCVPLPTDASAAIDVPLEQRTDRDLYMRVFQMRDGRWHQCKTWLSRRLFF